MAHLIQKHYDCLVWGGYGRGNIGDEWCLAAALGQLREKHGSSLAVLSPQPEYTSWLFPDTTVVPYVYDRPKRSRRSFFKRDKTAAPVSDSVWLQNLRQSGCLYLAGGGYLNDLFDTEAILAPIEQALALGLPVATAPVGLGPFGSAELADRFANILRKMDLRVRDPISLDFCERRGIKAALLPDDAFGEIARWAATLPRATVTSPPKIGMCIFPQYGRDQKWDFIPWWRDVLSLLKDRLPDAIIEGFCFHTSPGAEFFEMVRLFKLARLPLSHIRPPALDFRAATASLRDYSCIISTRFHAVIAANLFGIPNLAVASGEYYQAKMTAAVDRHESISHWLDPAASTPEAVFDFCRDALKRSGSKPNVHLS